MINQVSKYFQRYTSRSNVLFLGIILILMIGVILPEAESGIELQSGGIGMIDNSFFYQPDLFYDSLKQYGANGRKLYLFTLLTADLFLSIILTLFSTFFIALLVRSFKMKKAFQFIKMPFFYFLLNLFENLGIIFLMLAFPAKFTLLARLTAIFTLGKWVALIGIISIIIGIVFLRIFSKLKSADKVVRNGNII